MKVFLKSSTTGQYLSASGQFDTGPGKAMEFPSVQHATRHAVSGNLTNVEVVLRCDSLSQEVFLPILPDWCHFDENHNPRISGIALDSSNAPAPPA